MARDSPMLHLFAYGAYSISMLTGAMPTAYAYHVRGIRAAIIKAACFLPLAILPDFPVLAIGRGAIVVNQGTRLTLGCFNRIHGCYPPRAFLP